MKFLVLALAVACAYADVSHLESQAETVSQQVDVQPENFQYAFQTSNGIQASSNGVVKNVNSEYPAQEVQGSYSYTGPDGVVYTVTYKADENGYQAQGAHLPTSPPVPADIARSLEFIAKYGAKVVSEPFVATAKAVAPTFQSQQYPNKPQQFKPAFQRL